MRVRQRIRFGAGPGRPESLLGNANGIRFTATRANVGPMLVHGRLGVGLRLRW